MFQNTIEITNPDIQLRYAESLRYLPDETADMADRAADAVRDTAVELLRVEPPETLPGPKAGFTPQERRAYFAKMKARGYKAPYKYVRSHLLIDSWRLGTVSSAYGITSIYVSNDAQDEFGHYYETFVTGPDQRPYHAETGWQEREATFEDIRQLFVDRLDIDLAILAQNIRARANG